MANDARISISLPGHPKTKKLIRRQGEGAAWRLICLFLWVAENRSDGNLAGMSAEDIELAADWQGDEGAFVAALVDVGFLDGEEGGYSVHDWAEHNPWAAGANDRSEASKWAALCKRYGRKGAAERMPEYAARMRPAPEPQEPASDPDAELCDPHAPRTERHAEGENSQCPATVSVTDTVSDTTTDTKTPSCAGSDKSPPPQQQKSAKAKFDYEAGRFVGLSESMVRAWTEAYPAVDVRHEIAKAKAWLLANPKNRKSNLERFLTNWLTKAQDRAPAHGQPNQTQFAAGGSRNENRPKSAVERVRDNAARERARLQAAESGGDYRPVGADVGDVRPQVDIPVLGRDRPGERVGRVFEGAFERADQERAESVRDTGPAVAAIGP